MTSLFRYMSTAACALALLLAAPAYASTVHGSLTGGSVAVPPASAPAPSPAPAPAPVGGNGPPAGTIGPVGPAAPAGQVLGASTSAPLPAAVFAPQASSSDYQLPPGCAPLITHYLHVGRANDESDMRALQSFLNTNLGLSLPVTGFFDQATFNAVEAFQLKYAEDVLAPWVPFGLPSSRTPTGYVYKTTSWKINSLACASLEAPFPTLP